MRFIKEGKYLEGRFIGCEIKRMSPLVIGEG